MIDCTTQHIKHVVIKSKNTDEQRKQQYTIEKKYICNETTDL